MIRVRFAPSPTGYLHIGNAHTALFNWLFARGRGGKMILRIEDTDLERSAVEYERALFEDLRWLGMDWDEGVDVGGDYGPYRQSERLEIYREYARRLEEAGWVYPCFCTPEELAAERAQYEAQGLMPRYGGRCRHLTEEEKKAYLDRGVVPSLRFRVPEDRELVIKDLIRGDVVFNTDNIGDFVIMRPNGYPTYNFCVTVDDLLMKITHVIRADEHLSNTPRQLLLYEALGEEPPLFAHVSMLLGPDRTKLSKRHGAASVREYREAGYLPEAMLNYLALLGWSPQGEEEFFSVEELCAHFELERVSKSPAVFDVERLQWMNSQYLRRLPIGELARLSRPYLENAGLHAPNEEWLCRLLDLMKDQIRYFAELPEQVNFLFGDVPATLEEKARELLERPESQEILTKVRQEIECWPGEFSPEEALELLHVVPNKLGVKKGQFFRPLRAAVTGKTSGPELHYVLSLLGQGRILRRLDWACEKSSGR
ncbi:MAG TPA: glutamate--tRNA ligase [Firmicutes bacterium]|nr:glutamate--tRNA ligase [Bacillota bacterium]